MSHETDQPYERNEEDDAAAEAGAIGGPRPNYYDSDEAERPLEEAGEGESEGFELAEEDLIEEASHGDEGYDPEVDAFTQELESDEAGVEYGEADEEEEPDL
jgi:hypothetical protein